MIYILVGCIIITACAVEFYKKCVRGEHDENGIHTKAKSIEIYAVALVLSFLSSFLFYNISNSVGLYRYVFYTVLIYFLQYLVDMTLIKTLLNSFISKLKDRL